MGEGHGRSRGDCGLVMGFAGGWCVEVDWYIEGTGVEGCARIYLGGSCCVGTVEAWVFVSGLLVST